MTSVLIAFYSAGGHMEALAKAAADGVANTGAEAVVKRIPEVTGEVDIGESNDGAIAVAIPGELADYNGLLLGAPTRFGMMCAQIRHFLDQTGGLWMQGALVGKAGGVMTSTATQHGGQEAAILSGHVSLLHHGMVIVGLPYSAKEQMTIDEISGASPYGAFTITGGGGPRMPSEKELTLARAHGANLASVAAKLA